MVSIVGFLSNTTRYGIKREESSAGTQLAPTLTIASAARNGRETKTSRCAKKSTVLRCSKRSLDLPNRFAACCRKWRRWRQQILLSSYWGKPELERNSSPAPSISAPIARAVLLFV